MKKILFIMVVLFHTVYGSQLYGQTPATPEWTWAANIAGATAVAANDDGAIFTDTAGNSYIVKQVSTQVNIKKYDAAGTLVWDRTGSSGIGAVVPTDITVDTAGNYYITGSYTGTPTFGATILTNSGLSDIFIVKYDAAGTVVWAQKYSNLYNDVGNSIAVDSNGNCYVGGYSYYQNFASPQLFYAKYNSSGAVQWTKLDGYYTNISSLENVVNSIAVDNLGNTYLTGSFREFNQTRTFFIRKCDPYGNTVWNKKRADYSIGNDIVTDAVGNSYVTGVSYLSSTDHEIFTTKYDAAGQISWTRTAGGADKDYGDGVSIDQYGNCYISGRFQQSATFGSIAISNLNSGISDVFVAKYDNLGDIVWVQQAGESGEDAASKLGVDGAGNCYINGYYTTTTTFGATVLSGVVKQPFIAKIGNLVQVTESITTLPVASHNYNAGSAISVPFSTNGNFPVGTTFTVQLSDPTGSFFYPKDIGIGTTSPISCVIPSLTIPASGYRVRVIATTPAVFGTDNGSAITINGNSQLTTPDWSWATNITGTNTVAASDNGSIFTDTAGNSYIVNQINSHVNIKKYDATGTLVWDRTGSSGSGVATPADITVDATGNYYITGSYTGTPTFGATTLTNAGESDIFIVKYNSSGDVIWAQKYGDQFVQRGNSIAVDSSGNCYIGGLTSFALSNRRIFYAKYNAMGTLQWEKSDGGNTNYSTFDNGANGISVDSFGNTYITGFYRTASISGVAFVRKCDPSGNTVWNKNRTDYSIGFDIVTDAVGNSYVTGAVFTGLTATNYNIFTTKYNAAGVEVWTQNGIGLDNDYGYGIALDANGNCFVTGKFQHNTDFSSLNISNTSSGVSDIFVAKYDNQGNIAWLQQAGDVGEDAGGKIGVDAEGNCYINGYYTTSTNFGTTTLNGGIRTPFVAKIGVTAATTLGAAVVKGENFCGGAVVTVDFAITGSFEPDNIFTAQLSDASGSFENPTVIGTLESALNTSIYAIIPLETPAGTGYRIRVLSSNVALTGNENAIDIEINQPDCVNNNIALEIKPIAAVEYFIDTDPGAGNGIPLTTAGGLMVNDNYQITLPTLTPGFHYLFIRTKDSDGVWGMYEGRVFYVQPAPEVLTTHPVVAAEYFFDTEPGVGSGTALASFESANPLSISTQIPTTGLSEGFHYLFIRTKDSNQKWSMYEGRVVYIQPVVTSTLIEPIVAGEYYFNTDPGIGNGIEIETGAPAESITVMLADLATSTLSLGEHRIFIRVKDNSDTWSLAEERPFTICSSVLQSPAITGNAVVCSGQELTLTAETVEGATSYMWTGPNNYTAATQSINIPNFTESQIGEYSVRALNGTEACGMGLVSSITISTTTTAPPSGEATQTFTENQTIADIVVTGTNVLWYSSAENAANGLNPLDETTLLQDNTTYYATQTIDGCPSSNSLAITTTVALNTADFNSKAFVYYPNPVKDMLHLSYDKTISKVSVYNVLGQEILIQDNSSNQTKIDMAALPSGTYLVKVTAETTEKIVKIIKQ